MIEKVTDPQDYFGYPSRLPVDMYGCTNLNSVKRMVRGDVKPAVFFAERNMPTNDYFTITNGTPASRAIIAFDENWNILAYKTLGDNQNSGCDRNWEYHFPKDALAPVYPYLKRPKKGRHEGYGMQYDQILILEYEEDI